MGCGNRKCCGCYKLIRCDDPEQVIWTKSKLRAYVNHTVTIGDAYQWTVYRGTTAECRDQEFVDVTPSDVSSESATRASASL